MSEMALVSSRRFKLEAAAKKGNGNAQRALELSNNPNTFLSTVQIGITLIGILTGIYSGDRITVPLTQWLSHISFIGNHAETVAVAIVVVCITFMSIVFGELIPKRIGLLYPESIATLVARPMSVLSTIARPFVWLLAKTTELPFKLLGLHNVEEEAVSEEEIKSIIQESTDNGEIQEIEHDIVKRVFDLGDRKVSELMTHRTDIVWMDVDDDWETVKQKARKEIHSVYPVGDKTLDNLVGLLSVKDVFSLELTGPVVSIREHIKYPVTLHENTPAYKALEMFKEKKLHYGVVVDEYGALKGLVAMDDIMDALIGDASEYNHEEYKIVERSENSWLADAQIPYFEFAKYFQLDSEQQQAEFNTLAGFLISVLGHIPAEGEKINWQHYEFEIMDMDNMRIDKVLITKQQQPEE